MSSASEQLHDAMASLVHRMNVVNGRIEAREVTPAEAQQAINSFESDLEDIRDLVRRL